jgi:oligosaccharide reducing-end xylanase
MKLPVFKGSNRYLIYTALSIAVLSIPGRGQSQVPQDYQIARWYQFKKSAVTYTFDDLTGKQVSVAVPIFNKFNFKATIYPVINWSPNWTSLKTLSGKGFEIGSHTMSHANLSTVDTIEQEKELRESKSSIDAHITGAKCLTISYPFCATGTMAYVQSNYIAGRICSNVIEPATPSNLYKISSIPVGSQSMVKTAKDLNSKVTQAKNAGGWCVFLIHGIDDDGGYSPILSAELDTHLIFVNNNTSDYWVTTFLDAVKYIRERNGLSIAETEITSDSIQIIPTDILNDTIYNLPVTVKRKLPAGWSGAKVYYRNSVLNSNLSAVGETNYISFDLIPDQGNWYLVKEPGTSNAQDNLNAEIRLSPNPFTGSARVEAPGKFMYDVVNIDGKIIEKGTVLDFAEVGTKLDPGFYILNIRGMKRIQSLKIIKI